MSQPPDPHLPGVLLAAARLLGWQHVNHGFGRLYDPANLQEVGGRSDPHVLHIVGAGPGVVAWRLGVLPFWASPYLMTAETAAMLAGGAEERDGSFMFEGKCYRLRAMLHSGLLAAIPDEVGVCF